MSLDGTYRAVLDRIEDGLAVLEVDTDGDLCELVVDIDHLPEDARQRDAVLEVTLDGGEVVDANFEPRATRRRRKGAQRRFDRLSRRPPRDDDEE